MGAPVGEDKPRVGTKEIGISFNGLDEKDKIFQNFSASGPKWRSIIMGLNLEAMCKTPTCLANKQMVWIPKGFGSFDVVDIIFQGTLCPSCNQKTEDAENVGYWKCKYTVDGNMLSPERKKIHHEGVAPDGGVTTFKASQAKWATLTIKTDQI